MRRQELEKIQTNAFKEFGSKKGQRKEELSREGWGGKKVWCFFVLTDKRNNFCFQEDAVNVLFPLSPANSTKSPRCYI